MGMAGTRGAQLARMARRIALSVGLVVIAVAASPATGCTASNKASGPADCVAAGGQCVIPNLNCASVGPQDCNPAPHNAGGAVCCLAQGYSCELGGACSNAEPCMGGVVGCGSNCQCLDGVWQTPSIYIDGGPDGSFCCETGPEDAAVEGGDGGADASQDGGPADAHAE